MTDQLSTQTVSDTKQYDEGNQYVRANFQLLVTWFTFFLGVNYLAIGWYASEAFKSGAPSPSRKLLYLMSAFFIVQNVLAYFVCDRTRKYFQKADKELSGIVSIGSSSSQQVTSTTISLYNKVILLMQITLGSFLLFWVVLAVMA